MNRRTLAIFGAGGHGRVIADTALAAGWDDAVFFDDRFPQVSHTLDWPVLGGFSDLLETHTHYEGVLVGIGDNPARMAAMDRLTTAGARIAGVVHPRAWISQRARVEDGVVICAGALINVGARIGRGSIINTGATIDHDCDIGEGVHVAPGANLSGGVSVGSLSWIGVGACVRQGSRIGAGVMVGAGAVVVSDLPDGIVATGVPARARA